MHERKFPTGYVHVHWSGFFSADNHEGIHKAKIKAVIMDIIVGGIVIAAIATIAFIMMKGM